MANVSDGNWMDITTAPADGSAFLALIPVRKHFEVIVCSIENGRCVSSPGNWTYHPTHWTFLPQLPKRKE